MKVKFRYLILILLFTSVVNVNAQDITISSSDLVNLKNEIQQLKDSIRILNDTISVKNSTIESNIQSFNDKVVEIEALRLNYSAIKLEKESADSIIKALRNFEEIYNDQMKIMQETTDRNMAKLANGRLYFRYDDNLVLPSIQSLLDIKTESVKKDFEQALRLLQSYKDYSEDVKSTFVALQSIDRDEWKSKHRVEEYKKKCLSILKQSAYYQKVYTQKSSNSWSVPYLDNLIDVAKSIISKHNPVESEFANFSTLIEML